jgi:hypothetical protein
LLKEARLSYQKPRRKAAEADETEQERFSDELKKRREMDATVICIDQSKKFVQFEPRIAWFPRGTRPSIELSGQRDWTCLLGVGTEKSNRSLSWFTEYVTADQQEI